MSDRDRFAGLTDLWIQNEDLNPIDRQFVIDYLLRYLRGNQIVINSLPDVLEWEFNGDNIIFNTLGLTIPLASMYVNGFLVPTLENDSITVIRSVCVVGKKVYFGGTISRLGGLSGSNLVCLDLATGIWSIPAVVSGGIWAMSTDGTDLYVGTDGSGDGSTPYAMKLSSGSLSTLGTDLDGVVNAIYYDSNTDEMHFGGAFTNEGNYYAIWDVAGSSWSTVGAGFTWSGGGAGTVGGITGDGTSYYFTGKFDAAGGGAVAYAASLTGSTYAALGSELDDYGLDVEFFNGVLYACGAFTGKVKRYVSGAWETVAGGLDSTTQDLHAVGEYLYSAGLDGVKRFKDGAWETVGTSGGTVVAFDIEDYGESLLIFGGDFTAAGDFTAKGVALYFLTLDAVLSYLPSFSVTEASQLNFEPDGKITSTDTQAAVEELAEKTIENSSDTQIPVNTANVLTGSDNIRYDDATGNVFLGDTLSVAEAAALGFSNSVITSGDGVTRQIRQLVFGNLSPRIRSYYAKGSKASPTLPEANNTVYERIVAEYKGSGSIDDISNWSDLVIMRAMATQNHTTIAKGTKWEWTIIPDDSTTQEVGFFVNENGVNVPTGKNFLVNGTAITNYDGDLTDLDETSSTDIGEAIADDDQGIIYNTSGTAWVRFAWSRVKTYIKALTDTLYVALTGDQSVGGVKTFTSFPVTPSSAPTTDYQVANKKYVDDNAGSGGREVLTANRTYYVRTDGSDSNDGLTDSAGGAFLTIQKAVDVVAALDLSIYDVTIQIADGTYTGAIAINGPFIGTGSVTIQGNSSTPANVIISTTGADAVVADLGAKFTIKDLKIQTTTSGIGLYAKNTSIIYFSGINFGACVGAHILATASAICWAIGNYTISGNCARHWFSTGVATILAPNITITLSDTPAFSTGFAVASILSCISAYGNTYSGSATGKRYSADLNSVIYTNGATLPGNVAGTTATGGQYA